jgi:hypothetical protein
MTVTATTLTRAAGVSAVAAGLLFIGVQINHPHLDVGLVTTTEWTVRQSVKVAMTVLSLAGITGVYLRQVRQSRRLGLLGYLLFSAGYLVMMSIEVAGLCILPTLARSEPGYVNDVLTVAGGGHAVGDIGLMQQLSMASGIGFIGGGLIFGIALFRAGVLARWAAALLAVGTLATAAIPMLPQINERLFAIPPSVALIGLGVSLWRLQSTAVAVPGSAPTTPQLDPAGVR